jgi:hypothetical protein
MRGLVKRSQVGTRPQSLGKGKRQPRRLVLGKSAGNPTMGKTKPVPRHGRKPTRSVRLTFHQPFVIASH